MITDVVAALIWDHDRFLACQRPAHKARGLLWEFVGGKVEPGESLPEALVRECREELAVTVSVGEVFMTLVHEYPDLTVRLTLFNASIIEGSLQKLEHNDIRWITTGEIDQYDFCPADKDILLKLKAVANGTQATLISLADAQYRTFQTTLMPTVNPETVLGIPLPKLRNLAKKMRAIGEDRTFLQTLPHRYYDENNLHGILISQITDPDKVICELDRFLPYVDNWATCDLISPIAFRQRPDGLLNKVDEWLASEHTYTVRFAIGVLMRYYLDDDYITDSMRKVAQVRSNDYYVNMMVAWYFATALAKQYNAAIRFIEGRELPVWVHNKTIQKALESHRILADQKSYLKTLKVKMK